MGSRSLINLTIVLLIIGINWYVPDDVRQEIIAQPITQLKTADINTIEIIQKDSVFALYKKNGEWFIKENFEKVKNLALIEQLLAISRLKSYRDYAINQIDLSALELNPPLAHIRFNQTDIKFGIVEKIDGYRYIKIGDRIHLVNNIGLFLFNLQAHHLTKDLL